MDTTGQESGDDTQEDVARDGQDEAVDEERPQTDRRAQVHVVDQGQIDHAAGVNDDEAGEISGQQPAKGRDRNLVGNISRQAGAADEAEEIPESRLEDV